MFRDIDLKVLKEMDFVCSRSDVFNAKSASFCDLEIVETSKFAHGVSAI